MAKMRDFRSGAKTYLFNISVNEAAGESFADTLQRFKKGVPLEWRKWHEDRKLWEVLAHPLVEAALVDLFENGRSCLELVKSQLSLF